MEADSSFYDEKYFAWQKEQGEFSAKVNSFLFDPYIQREDRVLEFGSGGGYLLNRIHAKEKIGIEINPVAQNHARNYGLNIVSNADEVADNWATLLISISVLEHVYAPFDELKKLYRKLQPGGRVVFYIPHEIYHPYYPNEKNQHIYTWSPMCAGNLFTHAGFLVKSAKTIRYTWPPKIYQPLERMVGLDLFVFFCKLYANTVYPIYSRFSEWGQTFLIQVIANKPA